MTKLDELRAPPAHYPIVIRDYLRNSCSSNRAVEYQDENALAALVLHLGAPFELALDGKSYHLFFDPHHAPKRVLEENCWQVFCIEDESKTDFHNRAIQVVELLLFALLQPNIRAFDFADLKSLLNEQKKAELRIVATLGNVEDKAWFFKPLEKIGLQHAWLSLYASSDSMTMEYVFSAEDMVEAYMPDEGRVLVSATLQEEGEAQVMLWGVV